MELKVGTDNSLWLEFASACNGLGMITRGDHLVIATGDTPDKNGDNVLYFADAPDYVTRRVRVYPVTLPLTDAVPANVMGPVTSLQIVTSGRSNQLTASAGATTYHGPDYMHLEAVGPFTTASKYGSSAFTILINNWLSSSNQTTDKLPASNPPPEYSHMNMTAYANKLPPGCVKDPSDVKITDVVLAKQVINGKVKVSIVSFSVICDLSGNKEPIHN